jgi:hypothetical protein
LSWLRYPETLTGTLGILRYTGLAPGRNLRQGKLGQPLTFWNTCVTVWSSFG